MIPRLSMIRSSFKNIKVGDRVYPQGGVIYGTQGYLVTKLNPSNNSFFVNGLGNYNLNTGLWLSRESDLNYDRHLKSLNKIRQVSKLPLWF